MNAVHVTLLAFVATTVACVGKDDHPASKAAPQRVTSAAASAPTSSVSAPASATADADSAAKRFVEQGLQGHRLKSAPCIRRDAITCGSASVVASYTLGSAVVSGDSARIVARYEEVGRVMQKDRALTYVSADSLARIHADTFVLARSSEGWKVVHADTAPRLSAKLAMYYFDLAEADGERLANDARVDFGRAVRSVLTAPSALTQLPRDVRDTLTARGCSVLQDKGDSTSNVVRGALVGTEGDDWAVLCVVRGADVTLVFAHGRSSPSSHKNVTGSVPDVDALPNFDEPGMINGCPPAIYLIPAETIRELIGEGVIVVDGGLEKLTAAERKMPAHDGVGTGSCEEGGYTNYWTGKRWVQFPGRD